MSDADPALQVLRELGAFVRRELFAFVRPRTTLHRPYATVNAWLDVRAWTLYSARVVELAAFQSVVEDGVRVRGSIAELARETSIPPNVISRWLGAKSPRPSLRNLRKLAPALGIPAEQLLRLCGDLPADPGAHALVDARRQAVRDQLDRWLTAVGPEFEAYFWQHLKTQGDSTVDLIQRIGSAVSADEEASVSTAVSSRRQRGRKPREGGNGPLTPPQRATRMRLGALREEANELQAA